MHAISLLITGSDYDEVGERQKQRKENLMKSQIMEYTSNVYSDTGLIPTNFILKSPAGGTVVDLKLCPAVPELQTPQAEVQKVETMTYLVLKHHISRECYKDLAAEFPTLPRSHRVLYGNNLDVLYNPVYKYR